MTLHPADFASDPWTKPAPLWTGRLLVGAVVAWIVIHVWPGLFIPWWFNTDELVFFNEVIRQLRLDPGQTFFDIPGTPFMTLTSLLTAAWWVIERALGMSHSATASDFAFEHVQGVFTLMRGITLGCYAMAMGLACEVFRRAAGITAAVLAAVLAATLPIHVHYSHFVRTESLGLVLCFSALLLVLHPRTARRWQTYLFAGALAGVAMGARFHFALVGLPVLLSLYFLHDRPHLNFGDEKLPNRRLLNCGAALAGLFVVGGFITLLFRWGIVPAGCLTHTILVSTPAGPAEYAGAKQAVAKLWLLLGAGSLGLVFLYRLKSFRLRLQPFVNSFSLALVLGFAGGFLFSHPSFLWRGAHQLQSIQFYSDWVDPDLASLGILGSWWKVTRYYFSTALPELWVQIAFFAGIGTILWSRNRLAISFLIGALVCFVAHPVTMKLWAHHIIPWLPFLCFVAAHPFGILLERATGKLRSPALAVVLLVAATGILVGILPSRFARTEEYLNLSRTRTNQIEEMNRWLTLHVPFDSFLAVSYYALNGDGFTKWIESVGVTVPARMLLFPDTHIWWLQRGTLDGHAGYVCITRADIQIFRDDAERKSPGSTYNPFEDKRFEELATFGSSTYELKVFRFDLRDQPLAKGDPVGSSTGNKSAGIPLAATSPSPNAAASAQNSAQGQTELQQAVTALKAQLESLTFASQRQQVYATELKKELDRLLAEHDPLKRQFELLTTTSRQQADYIAVLEKERDRLTALVKAHEKEAEQTQVAALTATSRQQADFIAVLKKENERLAALAAVHDKDIEHYVQVIKEQTAYIKLLEAERKPPAQP